MSDDNKDDDFNQHNVIMMVKQVPKTSPLFACMNELHKLIYKMEWEMLSKE